MTEIRVTDHALVRVLQHREGIDVEGLRIELADTLARAHSAAANLKLNEYLVRIGGLTFVVRDGNVTAVFPKGPRTSRAYILGQRKGAPRP